MPTSIVIAAAATWAGTTVATAAFGTYMAGTWFFTATAAATSMVVGGALNRAIGGGGQSASANFTAQAQGRDQVVRSSVANRTVVYGRAMVSGPLVFAASSGSGNSVLHLVIPLAGHQIDAVEEVYFNDVALGALDASGNVTTGPYAGHARITKHLGAPGDAADADLVAANVGWSAWHKLSGVAYLALRLTYSQDAYPTGIPNIKALIRGKKLYDPRTGQTAWSTNPALAVRDYLMASYGLEASAAEVDDAHIIAAANVCDEGVILSRPSVWNFWQGITERRYTCNGVVDTGDTPRSIMEALLSSMAGHLVYSGGRYLLHPGAYTTPAVTLTADDLRGPVRVRPRISRSNLFNAVRGTFVSPAAYWQPTDFPGVSSATYAAQDGGQVIWRDMALAFTASSPTAQRIAKLMLQRSRQGITVEFSAKLTAFRLATLDTVMLTLPQLGWTAKEFKVLEWKFAPEGGVDLVLQEEAASSYAWNSSMETVQDPAPDTKLPNPFVVEAPASLTLASGTEALLLQGDGTVVSRILATWPKPASVFVTDAEVQYKLAGTEEWKSAGKVHAEQGALYIPQVLDGAVYSTRARFENSIGVRSGWVSGLDHTVVGKTTPPSNVPWLALNARTLSWGAVADADLAGYRLRWLPAGSTDWGQAQPLHNGLILASPWTPEALPSGSVTLLVKAVDTSGNESPAATQLSGSLPEPKVANVMTTADLRAAGFPGKVGGASIVDGNLLADAAGTIWNPNASARMWTTDVDAMWNLDYWKAVSYVATVETPAGAVGSQITLARDVTGEAVAIDSRLPVGDAAPMWGTTSTSMWVDDAAPMRINAAGYTPWPGAVTAEVQPRQIRVRTNFSRTRGRVDALAVNFDVPDRSLLLGGVAIAAVGTRLPIGAGWNGLKVVGLTLQDDGGAARTPIVIDKSLSGPLIKCLDASGVAVVGKVDAEIQGY